MANNNDIKLDQAIDDIRKLKEDFEGLSKRRLQWPPDLSTEDAIRRTYQKFLPEDILDIIWNDHFYIFGKLDNWATSVSGTAAVTTFSAVDKIRLATGGTQSSIATIFNTMAIQNALRYDRRQRFTSAFQVSSVADVTAYIVRGDNHTGKDYFYGFKIVNDTLKGVSKNNGGESIIDLQTISTSTIYGIQARLLPNEKILFLVQDADNPNTFKPRGVLSTELPRESTNIDLATMTITNDAGADKQMEVSYFEYLQKR